ncbi:DUF1415 domain-containing protein [Ramlibacter sp. AN1015]|uniref:DUF1415 domain-containing protein n=1 Tax=Ramlibacter sp. AN1015 TaxID=3133428 RepID=UPI0030C585A0
MPSDCEQALADTRRWLERAVVGLNLCPFAKSVLVRQQVHFAWCDGEGWDGVLEALEREAGELTALQPQQRDTTLLVLRGPADFIEFTGLVAQGERRLRSLGLQGVLQLASFHPEFQFAGTDVDDISNCTNRAPWPTLHLLREASLDRAVQAFPDAAAIYETNIATLQRLGALGWAQLGVARS